MPIAKWSIRHTNKPQTALNLQIFEGNFHTFSTAKLLIHASILMQNTVQIVVNSNTKLMKSKYDLKFAVNVDLKVPINES